MKNSHLDIKEVFEFYKKRNTITMIFSGLIITFALTLPAISLGFFIAVPSVFLLDALFLTGVSALFITIALVYNVNENANKSLKDLLDFEQSVNRISNHLDKAPNQQEAKPNVLNLPNDTQTVQSSHREELDINTLNPGQKPKEIDTQVRLN